MDTSIRSDRIIADNILWQWLELAISSRTPEEQILYDLIVALPSFAEDSISFCKSVVTHSKTVMLPQGSERLLEMWKYAETMLNV
jgi:hypothetical protein